MRRISGNTASASSNFWTCLILITSFKVCTVRLARPPVENPELFEETGNTKENITSREAFLTEQLVNQNQPLKEPI